MDILQIINLGIIAFTIIMTYAVFKVALEIYKERKSQAILLVIAMLVFIAIVVSLL